MKVLIVNTSELTGGAAVAANRLMKALKNNGVQAKMLVRDKQTDDISVVGIGKGWRSRLAFLWERWCIFTRLHFSKTHLFELDIANAGIDITRLPEFQEADVIHLHWINQGFLSLSGIQKMIDSGKPIVWTMHDIWPATAICHYARGCRKFSSNCSKCPLLPQSNMCDFANRIWKRKQRVFHQHSVSFVACSKWLAEEARKSMLLKEQVVTNIPNPIDTHVFQPQDQTMSRKEVGLPTDGRKIILFVSQRVTDERKGMEYFVKAVSKMVEQHPEMVKTTAIAILGGHSEVLENHLELSVFPLGYINDANRIVKVYSSSDMFVIPSLEDNLPNTIMEAMSCGVPCVGFEVGGIPEMIDHQKNGYVARFRDVDDLSAGMYWVLNEASREELRAQALRKVLREYSQQRVALKYTEVYNKAIAEKNYKL